MSAVSHLFDDFSTLLDTKRHGTELFKNFESSFAAQMARYNAHGSSIALPECIGALLLVVYANFVDSQRVLILPVASSKASSSVTESSSNEHIIKAIEYESIASVIRQCDNGSSSSSRPSPSSSAHISSLSGNPVHTRN